MGFNSAFKGLKLSKKKPGNGRLNNLNDPVLNVLIDLKLVFYSTTTNHLQNWSVLDQNSESKSECLTQALDQAP
jgi:hypothetical protein